jgi:hypothetical protein
LVEGKIDADETSAAWKAAFDRSELQKPLAHGSLPRGQSG